MRSGTNPDSWTSIDTKSFSLKKFSPLCVTSPYPTQELHDLILEIKLCVTKNSFEKTRPQL